MQANMAVSNPASIERNKILRPFSALRVVRHGTVLRRGDLASMRFIIHDLGERHRHLVASPPEEI